MLLLATRYPEEKNQPSHYIEDRRQKTDGNLSQDKQSFSQVKVGRQRTNYIAEMLRLRVVEKATDISMVSLIMYCDKLYLKSMSMSRR